jgi:hypothetical protein
MTRKRTKDAKLHHYQKKRKQKKMTQKYFSFSLIVEVERKKKWL